MEMRNVTITLDEEVADWVQFEATQQHTSVSRLVGELLREQMRAKQGYEAAMEHFLSAPVWSPNNPGPYPKRDELYDRPVLR